MISAVYYKCAEYGETQWEITATSEPIEFGTMTLSNVEMQLTGIVANNGTTWRGEITGSLDAVSTLGLTFFGYITFNSTHGIQEIRITTSLDTDFVAISFDMSYGEFDCSQDVLFFNIDDPATYFGLAGHSAVTIKSIHLKSKVLSTGNF